MPRQIDTHQTDSSNNGRFHQPNMRSNNDNGFSNAYNNSYSSYTNSDQRPNGFRSTGFGQAAYGYKSNYGGGYRSSGSNYGEYRQSYSRNDYAGGDLRPTDWSKTKMDSIQKNIYTENHVVTARSKSEIDAWLSENQVTLTGKDIPNPVFEFNEAGYPKEIESLLYHNYQKPTVIQSISWPTALSGRDMISIAKTGSGKTLGFILPAIMHTLSQGRRPMGGGPSVLVVLPTRELAQQVQEVAREYAGVMGLSSTCIFGGASKVGQSNSLRTGVDICIATPGRLLDFLDNGTTSLSRCSFLVLDEADRMLDMGFEPQIRRVISQIRPDRQSLMFSATWPKEIRQLAADFQVDPVFLNVGSLELSANHNIEQIVEVIEEHAKETRLYQILESLRSVNNAKVIIFVGTKRKADDLTGIMRRGGWPALCIHGDKEQRERDWVLSEFKSGKSPILLATDVAARGLDVDNITVVVNFDFPNNSEDYVHRIGRTGRRDNKGTAHTFFTYANASKARDLIKVLQEAQQVVPESLQSLAIGGYSSRTTNTRSRFNGQRSQFSSYDGPRSYGNSSYGGGSRW
ncbi:RNA helicase [Aphelenchoides besseyi]|nr:RNA helicase [Aphelenchoides besseyi]KAI6202331.1 RNA helicase [Aphelenchoides besseyi]